MVEKAKSPELKAKSTTKKTTEKKDGTTKKDNPTKNKTSVKEKVVAATPVKAVETSETQVKPVKAPAKAGKRSPKAVKEVEEKQAKEEHKAEKTPESEVKKPKQAARPARSRLERRSKKFREAAKAVEVNKEYSLKEALDLAVKTSPVKFDATVELHVNLNLDPRQADQNIRDNVTLPAGSGKTLRITVLGEPDDVVAAKKAGADEAGNEEILAKLEKGVIDFDVLITTPQQMAKLGKYARVLGPKGLMPNPKSGTVTKDVAKAVTQAKTGRVEYRVDSTGIVHLGIGKISFGADKLGQNAAAIVASIKSAKPSSVKGIYVRSVYITTSMGPSIRVLPTEVS